MSALPSLNRANARMNRRGFLKLTGLSGGGFALSLYLPEGTHANEVANSATTASAAQLNAFVQIASNGRITILAANPDMGQGVKTSIPMIAAEELGARWSDVTVQQAPVNNALYGEQRAGGSTTTPRCFDQMRKVGAAARQMLIGAAAERWGVAANECVTRDSTVVHADSNRSLSFGELAIAASRQPIPDVGALKFKGRKEYTLLGTAVGGVDNRAIVTGQPLFGIDIQVPGMLYAAYQKSPRVYGKALRANLDVIKAVPGIVDAFILEGNGEKNGLLSGVAIVGKTTWDVMRAKRQLKVEWDESQASRDSWTALSRQAELLAGKQGEVVLAKTGDVDAQLSGTDNKTLASFYTYPFVYHATLEPMNCTAHFQERAGKRTLEVWVPTQAPERIIPMANKLFGVAPANTVVHQTRVGGAFGRRGSLEFVCEAVAISQRVNAPVKLTWTREDDMENDYLRVGGFQSLRGAVDKRGKLVAWDQHVIGMSHNGEPASGVNFNANEFPLLNVSNARGTRTLLPIKTPTGPWRAPGANTMSWPVQSFIHELAHAAGRDHVEFLLEIMGEPRWFEKGNVRSLNTGRAAAVIQLAAVKAGWGKSLPKGRGLGLAFHFCHAGHVAEVAEVSVDANKKLTVHQVTVVADVGLIINLSGAKAQMEGAIIDGLSTMLALEITMEDGRIQQTNYHQYPMLRIKNAPRVDVHFIQSEYAPTGLGEPALPPLAPAIGNAIFAATGHRIRTMPISKEGFSI